MKPQKLKVDALNRIIYVRGVPVRTPFDTILRTEKEASFMKNLLHSQGITDYSITPIKVKTKKKPIYVESELDIHPTEDNLLPFEKILANTTEFESEEQEKDFLIDYAKTKHGFVFTRGFKISTMYDRLQAVETTIVEKKVSTILEKIAKSE